MRKLLFILVCFVSLNSFSQDNSERYTYFFEKGKKSFESGTHKETLNYFKEAYEADSTKSEVAMYYGICTMQEALIYYRLRDKFFSSWNSGLNMTNRAFSENSELEITGRKYVINNYSSFVQKFSLCDYYTKAEVQSFFDDAFRQIEILKSLPNYEQGSIDRAEAKIKQRYDIFRFEMKGCK